MFADRYLQRTLENIVKFDWNFVIVYDTFFHSSFFIAMRKFSFALHPRFQLEGNVQYNRMMF